MNKCQATQTALLHATCTHAQRRSAKVEKTRDSPASWGDLQTVRGVPRHSHRHSPATWLSLSALSEPGGGCWTQSLLPVHGEGHKHENTDVLWRCIQISLKSHDPLTNIKSEHTFLSLSLLFFTSSLLPCSLPPPLPPPPPPPPSPPPPAPAPGTAPPPWAPPPSPWPAGSLALASWFSLLSGLDSFLPMPGTTPSCSRQSMMFRATSQILELMSWLRTA